MKQTKTQTCLSKLLLAMILTTVFFACKKSDSKPAPQTPVISYNQKIVSVKVGESIPTLIPDSSKGGSVTQYSIYPGLPKGLSLNQINGVITGTPSDSLNPTRFVISAYGPGGLGRDTITIAVGTVGFVYGTTGNFVFTKNSTDLATTALAPTVLAGTFKKFYLDPNSTDFNTKTGLNFDPATGKISGTPSKLTSASEVPTPYQLVVAGVTYDNKVAYDTINITINDAAPVTAGYAAFKGSYTVGVGMNTLLVPVASTTGPVVKYRLISPASLPDGVHLDSLKGYIGYNAATGAIDTPRAAFSGNVVIRAINTGGSMDLTVPFTVNGSAVAPQIKYLMSFYSGSLVDSLVPSINSGGSIYLTKQDANNGVPAVYCNTVVIAGQAKSTAAYAISPAMTGMSVSTGSGLYSGTPGTAVTIGDHTETITIQNAATGGLPTGSFTFDAIVNAPFFTYNNGGTSPSSKAGLSNYYNFLQGQNVTAPVTAGNFAGYSTAQLSAGVAAGITDPITYTIYPVNTAQPFSALTGLSFNSTTGAISGTPTVNTMQGQNYANWVYIIVGKKGDGSFTYYKINIKIYANSADWADPAK